MFPSLADMSATYDQMGGMLELLENKVDRVDLIVLSKDAVALTLPIHLRIKAKGLQEYQGQYIWTGIVQNRNGKWVLIQTHESWLNFAEAMAALTPPAG